jgi:PAS domain S-box-containing protein
MIPRELNTWSNMKGDDKKTVRRKPPAGKESSADRWKLALESAGDGVWDWNVQTSKVYFSDRWKAMLGFEKHEIGDTLDEWEKRVHPDDRKEVFDAINRHLEGKTSIYISEHRVMCKDGSYKFVLDRGQIISRTPEGKPLRVVGTHTDLTRLKQTENLIRIQRDLGISLSSTSDLKRALNLVLEAALQIEGIDSGGVYIVNQKTGELSLMIHTGLSPQFIQSCSHYSPGTPQARLISQGKPIYDHYKAIREILNVQMEIESLHAAAIIPVLHDGKAVAVLNLASHTYDEIPAGSRNAIEDLATRVGYVIFRIQAETALRESEENLQALFDTVEDMLFILDSDGRILKTNPIAQQCLGYAMQELSKMHVLDIHPPERRQEAANIIAEMLSGKLTACPIPVMTKAGVHIPVETKVTRGKWSGRDVLFGLSRDITERKRFDEILKKNSEHLEELVQERTESLIKMNKQLQHENIIRERVESTLRSREVELENGRHELEEMNAALKILLKQVREDKDAGETNIIANIKGAVYPYLNRLKASGLNDKQKALVSVIDSNLKSIASSFIKDLSSRYLSLTPVEIQVATLVKDGLTSKEIAELLNISLNTVNTHRYYIRKKTGLKNKKVNLRTFIKSKNT